jgi:hypothetical protein
MAQQVDLIRQALTAAESSIKLARQLLSDIEKEGFKSKSKAKELPGVTGIFDGQGMTDEKGGTHPVPENYASKSILVVGDTLKLVGQGKEKRFKQVEHVKRHKTTGILAKKDGKWTAVTSEGSYKLLPAAVEYFDGAVGDEVLVQLPASNLQTTWAAVEKITKKEEAKPKGKVAPIKAKEMKKDEKEVNTEKSRKDEKQNNEAKTKEEKKPPPKEKAVTYSPAQSPPQVAENKKEARPTQAVEDELS